jgi:hypothetical protein
MGEKRQSSAGPGYNIYRNYQGVAHLYLDLLKFLTHELMAGDGE